MNMRLLFAFISLNLVIGVASAPAQQNDARTAGSRFALVMGNANYPNADPPLKEPVSDARAVGQELRRDGFDVEVQENLDKGAMQAALRRLYEKIGPGSVAMLFFSGYGIQLARQSYMIPIDAQILKEEDVRRDGIRLDGVLSEMDSRGASVKIAILDASRPSRFETNIRRAPAGLAPPALPKGAMVVFSAAPGSVVRNPANSPFVSELLKEMAAPGSADEVFRRTRNGVIGVTAGDQIPDYYSSSTDTDFSFGIARRAGPVASTQAPSGPPPPVIGDPPSTTQGARPTILVAPLLLPPPVIGDPPSTTQGTPPTTLVTPLSPLPVIDPPPTTQGTPPTTLPATLVTPLPPPPVSDPPPTIQGIPPAALATPLQPPPPDPDIQELTWRIEKNPKDTEAFYKRGQRYASRDEFSAAISDFDQVVSLKPRDAEALNNRCWAQAVLDQLQAALKDCEEALRIRPVYPDALDSRGFVHLKGGRFARAIADFNAALQGNNRLVSSLYLRGVAKLRSGMTANGNKDIAAAKNLDPGIADQFAKYGIY
jgi:Caspase domain